MKDKGKRGEKISMKGRKKGGWGEEEEEKKRRMNGGWGLRRKMEE